LGSSEVYYNNSAKPMDDYHEVGLMPVAGLFPKQSIAAVVLRDKTVISTRFPGSTGYSVPTGYGNWNDTFNALPATLLTRP
jgi:hypothetical protein